MRLHTIFKVDAIFQPYPYVTQQPSLIYCCSEGEQVTHRLILYSVLPRVTGVTLTITLHKIDHKAFRKIFYDLKSYIAEIRGIRIIA